jgi:DNA-binding CsgD family transcriptional regulator
MYRELKSDDFRAVYHLLGECVELWLDPAAWQDHLLGGISLLIDLPVSLRADLVGFACAEPVRVVEAREHGWPDPGAQKHFAQMMRRNGPFAAEPLDASFRQLVRERGDLTLSRADLVANRVWQKSEAFNLAHHPVRMDEMLYSAIRTGPRGRVHLLAFGGDSHPPTRRDCELLDFLHHELVPLIGAPLSASSDYSMQGLSSRRREILSLIAAGLTEKQMAEQLGIRSSTVNEQIQQLYLHFGLHTRARLMAYLLERTPRARR